MIMGQMVLVNRISLSRSYLKWIIEYVHVNEVAAPINLTVNVDTSVPTVFDIQYETTVQLKLMEDPLTPEEINRDTISGTSYVYHSEPNSFISNE